MLTKRRKVGRPAISETTKNLVVKLYNEDKLTCEEIAESCNISKSSLFRIINEKKGKKLNGIEN